MTYVDARPESGGMALRVVFAEDNYLVRAGTAALLAESEHLELVGMVGTGVELLAAVAEHRPDVVLTDIRMPPTWTNEGIEAALRIRREHPATGVVVPSQYASSSAMVGKAAALVVLVLPVMLGACCSPRWPLT